MFSAGSHEKYAAAVDLNTGSGGGYGYGLDQVAIEQRFDACRRHQ